MASAGIEVGERELPVLNFQAETLFVRVNLCHMQIAFRNLQTAFPGSSA